MMEVSPMRAMWLLAGLRLRRLANMLVSARMRPKAGAAQAGRTATPGKRGRGVLLGILVVSAMLFSFGNMARQSVINMQCEVGQYSDCYVEDGDGGRTQDVR
ncbi:MAG: hypothetical protein ACLGI6_19985, partial [Gammaproteobacteria bacterium]